MRTVIFCEGTTDLLMLQFVLQYKYHCKYDGFLENTVTNRLLKRKLVKDGVSIEIRSCGGMMNIPSEMKKLQEQTEFATRTEEYFDKVIVLIDHDTNDSNKDFIDKVNDKLQTNFKESDLNILKKWKINNVIIGELELDLYIRCIPENETGAIETIMLQALATDTIEEHLIEDSKNFILKIAQNQKRYLQKKSLISKAIFNTYFAIRTPEEKYDERARILKAYDWEGNVILNDSFGFLDIFIKS